MAPIVLEPSAVPIAPAPRIASATGLGGAAIPTVAFRPEDGERDGVVLIDDAPVSLRLDRVDAVRAVLVEGQGGDESRSAVIMLSLEPAASPPSGVTRREVIVDGWRIEVEIESERRASLRERASRGRDQATQGGPTEVRAVIPGRVLAVSIVPGEPVVTGQQLLVIEAMKMQNELRAPRDGLVSSVAVGPGRTIEVGDLLLVLE